MSQHDNTIYGRGVVLGLTMAEIVILVIFCLLLLFNVIVSKKNSEIKRIEEEVKRKEEQIKIIADYPSLADALEQIYSELNQNSFEDAFREIVLIKEQASTLKKENETLNRQLGESKKFKELVKNSEMSPQIINDIIETAKNIEKEIGNRSDKITLKDVPDIIRSSGKEIKNSKDRIKYIQRQCRGTEKPACWVDTASGKAEYIFQIALASEGVILHDNKLSHRVEEQKELPIGQIPFHKLLSADQFRHCTRDLFQWSEKKDCRFFVKVIDKTQYDEKKIYKKRLRTVEEHFYKYEATNNNPSWFKNDIKISKPRAVSLVTHSN